MNWTEEGVARLLLFQRAFTCSTSMISFYRYFTLAGGDTTTTSLRALAPTSPLSKLAIDWAIVQVALNLLCPCIFCRAFNSSMVHLRKANLLLCVQATTTSNAATIDLLPVRHYAVNWAGIFVTWHLTVQIGWALLASEQSFLIDGSFFIIQTTTA
jgi:hypothetical protein